MDELANYGEYSGAPSEQQTYDYAKTILSLMTREQHPQGEYSRHVIRVCLLKNKVEGERRWMALPDNQHGYDCLVTAMKSVAGRRRTKLY